MLGGCGRSGAPSPTARLACPQGVVAQTRAAPLFFSRGWTRLVLAACLRTQAAGRLEVEGADHLIAYTPGRPGGVTAAVLTAGPEPSSAPLQVFLAPAASSRAREVVLAPWPFPSPSPRLRRIRLLAADGP